MDEAGIDVRRDSLRMVPEFVTLWALKGGGVEGRRLRLGILPADQMLAFRSHPGLAVGTGQSGGPRAGAGRDSCQVRPSSVLTVHSM